MKYKNRLAVISIYIIYCIIFKYCTGDTIINKMVVYNNHLILYIMSLFTDNKNFEQYYIMLCLLRLVYE